MPPDEPDDESLPALPLRQTWDCGVTGDAIKLLLVS